MTNYESKIYEKCYTCSGCDTTEECYIVDSKHGYCLNFFKSQAIIERQKRADVRRILGRTLDVVIKDE